MSSTRERAWLAAHQKGSKALVQRLDKAHANNPEYQAFKKKHGLGDTSSVKQVSKSTVDRAKEKARQTLAGKAYGATKGTRMGSAEGTGETLRDTIAPLTRDQHSAVKAAEREAKAAEKPAKPAAAPKKPAKPKKEKAAAPAPEKKKPSALELIAAAAAKRKINQPPVSPKALRRIAAVGDMEHDHGGFEDLGDTQYGGRHSYNEETIVEGNDEDLRSKSDKELQRLHAFWKTRVELIPSPRNDVAKEQLAKIKAIFAEKKGKKIREEVEQIDEITITNVTPPRGLPGKSSAEMGREYRQAMKKWNEKNPPGKYDPEAHMKNVLANLKKEEVEQVDEIYALSAANYQAELRRQEKAKIEHKKNLERKAKEQLDKDSEDTGNPFANWKPVKEAKKHHMGGALFTDTAARLQKAINAHKERMDQMTNGPEHEYHHPTLDIRAKSRVKFPAPWVKVEDK